MDKKLKYIKGIGIPSFPLKLVKVGDLIYFEGSLMSLHIDENNTPYIYDWVESDSHSNRWIVYEVDEEILHDYIYKKISHFSLIQSALKDLYYILDINSNNEIISCKIVTLKNIPNSYIPKSDIYFEEDDAVGLDTIISTLKLDEVIERKSNDQIFDILAEAQQNKTELINLHIKANNSKVGYGKIRTSVLGETLVNFQKLNITTAISIFDGKDRVPKEKRTRRKKGQKGYAKELGETEYLYAKAASFSVFLKPIKQTVDIYEKISSETIAECIFSLFKASNEVKSLKDFKEQIDNNVLIAYSNFLKGIKEEDVSVTLQYANPNNSVTFKDNFDKRKAMAVIDNLEVVEIDNKAEIKTTGKFTALDRTNYTFKFYSSEQEEYEGKFSNLLQQGITTFNLKDFYAVVLEIEEVHTAGKIDNKEKIVMVSCVEFANKNETP